MVSRASTFLKTFQETVKERGMWDALKTLNRAREAWWEKSARSLVGKDEFGNQYYESTRADSNNGRERWVEYKVKDYDASYIPPEWHVWLHHIKDAPPTEDPPAIPKFKSPHKANPTGSEQKYLNPGHRLNKNQNHSWWSAGGWKKQRYEPWNPNATSSTESSSSSTTASTS